MRKHWKKISIFTLVISTILIISLGYFYRHFWQQPLLAINQPAVTYILKPGTSLHQLAFDLQKQNLLTSPMLFKTLAYVKQVQKHLKAGEYLIVSGTTPGQLLDQIANGRVVLHRFTIIEGWTFKQLLAAVNKEVLLTHTLNNLSSTEIANKLELTTNNLEGVFFPDRKSVV